MGPLFLLGATASGKHKTALIAAERLGAEIISVDSMKVYRGMDVGTAKPPATDLARVPHRLLDICDPSETYSAGRFVEDAARAEEEVRARGKLPFFVGGTALYYKAYVYGLFRGPSADPVVRQELVALSKERGSAALHDELKLVDPESAARIHPNDLKRLVRALEVYRKTGSPISSFQKDFDAPSRGGVSLWLERGREDIRKRIEARTRRMFDEGLVEETGRLLQSPWGKEGRAAVGYREAADLIEGRRTREEAERETNRRTEKFSRRQLAWFRSFPESKPIFVRPDDTAESVAEKIVSAASTGRAGTPR